MNTITYRLLAIFAIAALLSPRLHAEPLIELDYSKAEVGSAPTTERYQIGATSHALESINVTDASKLEISDKVPGFTGKTLSFIKGAAEARSPRAVFVNDPGFVTSGKVKFTWEAQIDSFTASATFPGFEALLNFVLMDKGGKPFFNFYYLMGKDQTGGVFALDKSKFGTWTLGSHQQFELTLDLDSNEYSILVDGTETKGKLEVVPDGGIRVVQFCDGAGLAFYGSQFKATIGSFKMSKL